MSMKFRDISLLNIRGQLKKQEKNISNIFSQNSCRPIVLFNTINSVLNPNICVGPNASFKSCEDFKYFFVNKIDCIRGHIIFLAYEIPELSECCRVLEKFELVSLPHLL